MPLILDDSIFSQPWFIIVGLLLIFGVIVLAVILLKKYATPFKNQDKPKSDKEIAHEEVERLIEYVDEEPSPKASEDEPKADVPPSAEEVAHEEVNRVTEEIDDPEVAKAMEEYAKAHPEESAKK